MEKQNAKQNMRCRGKLLPVLLLLCVALTMTFGFVLAKYVRTTDVAPAEADAAKFYFTSDILTKTSAEGNTYYISFADLSKTEITFELYNFKDKLNASQMDITYTLQYQVGGNAPVAIDGMQNLTLAKGNTTVSHTLNTSHFGKVENGSEITVWAVATAPYDETLKATFVITKPDSAITLSVSDSAGSNAALVTLNIGTIGAGSRTVTFYEYPAECILDTTDDRITVTGGKPKITVYGDNKYTFVFYKKNPSTVYTENDFEIS